MLLRPLPSQYPASPVADLASRVSLANASAVLTCSLTRRGRAACHVWPARCSSARLRGYLLADSPRSSGHEPADEARVGAAPSRWLPSDGVFTKGSSHFDRGVSRWHRERPRVKSDAGEGPVGQPDLQREKRGKICTAESLWSRLSPCQFLRLGPGLWILGPALTGCFLVCGTRLITAPV